MDSRDVETMKCKDQTKEVLDDLLAE